MSNVMMKMTEKLLLSSLIILSHFEWSKFAILPRYMKPSLNKVSSHQKPRF